MGGCLAQVKLYHCPDSRGRWVRKFSAHIWSYQNSFHVSTEKLAQAPVWKGAWLSRGLVNLEKKNSEDAWDGGGRPGRKGQSPWIKAKGRASCLPGE